MNDPVFRAFLCTAADDAAAVGRESDILRLVGDPRTGDPPNLYYGVLTGLEHLELDHERIPRVTRESLPFRVYFPHDYCRAFLDPALQFRVVTFYASLFHPNVSGSQVCLGPGFRAGTRLRTLAEQIYGIASSRVFATDHAFDPQARQYFLDHIAEIRALRAPPLWRRPVATRVRVRRIDTPEAP